MDDEQQFGDAAVGERAFVPGLPFQNVQASARTL
jgi:hypothetical protein